MLNSIYDIYYIKFALQFVDKQIDELVTTFNREVDNNGWVGMRAYHNQALIDEFIRRGINVTCVYDGHRISFAHPITYDMDSHRLILIS